MKIGYLDSYIKNECTGCQACAQICGTKAIEMQSDAEGFFYPVIMTNQCVHCNQCRTRCPISCAINVLPFQQRAFAMKLKDESSRMKSASGGAFAAIAQLTLEKDGIVFGAAWDDDFQVKHIAIDNVNDLHRLKKSKYLQSDVNTTYSQCLNYLIAGKDVLYSGTPCQIAGLSSFLGKKYDRLTTVDLICHGVPSNMVFKKYLNAICSRYKTNVKKVEFRYKYRDAYGGVSSRNILLETERSNKVFSANVDAFLRGFHSALYYRPSCHMCQFAKQERVSDITLGDYWNIQKLFSDWVDFTGVSSLLINTEKGLDTLNKVQAARTTVEIRETDVAFLLKSNAQLKEPPKMNKNRQVFFDALEDENFIALINRLLGKPNCLFDSLKKLLPYTIKKQMKEWLKKVCKKI